MAWDTVSVVLGGLGLFLLGMTALTDGLKAAAGRSLAALLGRFTRGRISALATGCLFTALIQSSSATGLAALGFVNAGLLDLGAAIGIVYGANLGTTFTAWLVSLVGVKVKVSALALPVVGLGALLGLLSTGRVAAFGRVLGGLGLLFLGIDFMQEGMSSVGAWDVGAFSAVSLPGRVALAGLGAAMTVAMQSSSAALAVTLTALAAGTIGLPEAAALAVGQNVGTTATVALGALGGQANAKRAAVAHVIFNVVTGGVVLLAFGPLLEGVLLGAGALGITSEPNLLSSFHTVFNLLGIVLMTPFIPMQARWLLRLVSEPEAVDARPRHLDKNLVGMPAAALDAVAREIDHLAELAGAAVNKALSTRQPGDADHREAKRLRNAARDLATAIAAYVEGLATPPEHAARAFSLLRTLTHYRSAAAHAVRAHRYRVDIPDRDREAASLAALEAEIRACLALSLDPEAGPADKDATLKKAVKRARRLRKDGRRDVLTAVAAQKIPSASGLLLADLANQLERIVYDLGRAAHHRHRAEARAGTMDLAVDAETEPELE